MTLADSLAGSLAANVCARVASCLQTAFVTCEEEGRPLTEVQRADITAAFLQGLDGLSADLSGHIRVDAILTVNGARIRDELDGSGDGAS